MFFGMHEILKGYKDKSCLWGLKPNKYVVKISELLGSGNILDLGVGEGRNALFLAKKGFDVIGVDISELAIKKFLDRAKEKKLQVSGVVKNITDYDFEEKYDAIICTATIHFVRKNKMNNVIKNMKKMTKTGGLNLITAFTEKDPGYIGGSKLNFIKENYLKEAYKDWKILESSCYVKKDTHGKPHKHHICVLFAKNAAGS